MFKFITDWFGKKPHPNAEAPAAAVAPYKVEQPAQVAPTTAPAPVAEAAPAKKAPAKKRTFVKRQEGGAAKVAKIKVPAKPTKPKAK